MNLLRVLLAPVLSVSVLLTGCSTVDSWFKDSDRILSSSERRVSQFAEPNPGQSVGVRELWSRSVAGSPDKYLFHPSTIAVESTEVFVGTFQGQVVAVRRQDGDVLWRADVDSSPVAGGVAVSGASVYTATVKGAVVALSRHRGDELWRAQLPTSAASAPVVADGKVILTTIDNRTYALDSADGHTVWSHVGAPSDLSIMGAATPVVASGVVLLGYSSGEIAVLGVGKGNRVWGSNLTVVGGRSELDLLQDVDASLVVSPTGAVIAANHQGRLVALDPRDGHFLWERPMSVLRRPLVMGDRLFVADVDGNLVCLQLAGGSVLWRTPISDGLATAPVWLSDRIVVADNKNRLLAIDPATGGVIGKDRLSDAVYADPVVEGGELFLWTYNGTLLKFL
ncbi:MAG: PQQ-binding-like beta-propeller repeat protein [Magnetococcales bacterium]|nr:PQQ-binding-like beta-propeller repeat protein [Magnetococcales bacterium]